MPWVLPQGISHVVAAVASIISQLVFRLWNYVVPLYIYLVGTLPPWCWRKAGSVTKGQILFFVWLCVTSLAQDLRKNFTSASVGCCPLRLVLCKGRGSFLACGGCPWCSASREWVLHASPWQDSACFWGSPLSLGTLGSSSQARCLLSSERLKGAGSSPLHHTRGRVQGAAEEGYWPDWEMVSRAIFFFESQSYKYTHKCSLFWGLAA